MYWIRSFGLMTPIREAVVEPGSNVIRCATVAVAPVVGCTVAPGVTATGPPPAEFNGILACFPTTSPPGFAFCRTAWSALYLWAREAQVSPLWTVWNVTHGGPYIFPALPIRGTVTTIAGRMKSGSAICGLALRSSVKFAP